MRSDKKKQSYVIAIDAGTQSIRACIIDLNGQIIKIEKLEIDPYYSTEPGFAEQDANYLWSSLCETTQKLVSDIPIPLEQIKGMSITTQRSTVVNLDKEGNPLRPAIIWLDQRKAKLGSYPKGLIKRG